MKIKVLKTVLLFTIIAYQSCSNETADTVASDPGTVEVVQQMKIKAFNDVNTLVSTLSENGIGTLKPWQDPYDTGYGSVTDYHPIGTAKVEYGLTNNLAYYLDGTATTAKNLSVVLNVNNPDEKKQGLAYLSDITTKTFKSLKLKVPAGLIKAIKSSKIFKSDNPDFITTFTLDQSKIETWKILIVSK